MIKDPALKKAIAISVALLLISLCVLLLPTISWHGQVDYLPEQFAMTGMVDTMQQQLAHQVWSLLIGITCACILFWPRS